MKLTFVLNWPLNQLPARPIAWPIGMAAAAAPATGASGTPARRHPNHAPARPKAIAPGMPSPPSHTWNSSTQSRRPPKYSW